MGEIVFYNPSNASTSEMEALRSYVSENLKGYENVNANEVRSLQEQFEALPLKNNQ